MTAANDIAGRPNFPGLIPTPHGNCDNGTPHREGSVGHFFATRKAYAAIVAGR